MDTPPQLKGPLSPIPLADDTVWVTKDGAWVIVGRRTWDRKLGAPSASGSSGSVPAVRARPRTEDDMGLVRGTGGSAAPPLPARARGTEPVLVQGRDPAKLGLIAAGAVLGVVLVMSLGVAVGMGLHGRAESAPEPLPVLQPVELSHPAPPDVKPVFRTPPVPGAGAADAEDTGSAGRVSAGTTVLLGRLLDDGSPKPDTPTFIVPPLPEAPPGETPHWLLRLTTGWRSVGPNPERAAKQFRRVAAARPKLPDGHLGLGVALIRLGHPEQAVEPLCAAAKLSHEYATLAQGPLDAIRATCP